MNERKVMTAAFFLLGAISLAYAEESSVSWRGQKTLDAAGYESYRILSPMSKNIKAHIAIMFDSECNPQEMNINFDSKKLPPTHELEIRPPKILTFSGKNGISIDVEIDLVENRTPKWTSILLYPETAVIDQVISALGEERSIDVTIWNQLGQAILDESIITEGMSGAEKKIRLKCELKKEP